MEVWRFRGSGFRGLGFRVQGLGVRVSSLSLEFSDMGLGLGSGVQFEPEDAIMLSQNEC